MLEEKLLRYAAPALYKKMEKIISDYHIHPYDVQATVLKNENGLEVLLRCSPDFSQSYSQHFSLEQMKEPDEEVNLFFQEAAKQCQSLLIADYYKMMKL